MRTSKMHSLVWVGALWAAAFSLACLIFIQSGSAAPDAARGAGTPALLRLLGGSRTALGGRLYLKADNVFHKGVSQPAPRAFHGWFSDLHDAIAPRMQQHLQPGAMQEVAPWLYFAIRMDPGNVTAYAVGAFWLAEQLGRPDLAIELLREAYRHHPRDYRVFLEQGRLWLRLGRRPAAARALDAGLRLWPRPLPAEEDDARLDLAQMRMYRAVLAELQGETDLAAELYAGILAEFPARSGTRARLESLRRGEQPRPPAADLLDNLLAHNRHICQHDHAGDTDRHGAVEHGHQHD